jgi:hypothetical protein
MAFLLNLLVDGRWGKGEAVDGRWQWADGRWGQGKANGGIGKRGKNGFTSP